jgi:hypothetical protein
VIDNEIVAGYWDIVEPAFQHLAYTGGVPRLSGQGRSRDAHRRISQ